MKNPVFREKNKKRYRGKGLRRINRIMKRGSKMKQVAFVSCTHWGGETERSDSLSDEQFKSLE